MRRCPKCNEDRAVKEFQRTIASPSGAPVTLPTRECIRCISADAKQFHRERKRRAR